MKILIGLFLSLLLALQGQLWLSSGGIIEWLRLTKLVEQQKIANEALVKRNTILLAEVMDLKFGLAAIEERARSELGMIRPNETFYQQLPE